MNYQTISSWKQMEHFSNDEVAILLTMYHTEDTSEMYIKNIEDWAKTGLDIYIVNSSPLPILFKHPKITYYHYDQKYPRIPLGSFGPSMAERDSILHAAKLMPLEKYGMIFKVTAKYFCPEFVSLLSSIPSDTDIVFQHQHNANHQNSELVGFTSSLFISCISKIHTHLWGFESMLYSLSNDKDYSIYRLPPLSILRKTPRSNGSILDHL